MRGWPECPRCGGTGQGEAGRGCGYGRPGTNATQPKVLVVTPYHQELLSEEERERLQQYTRPADTEEMRLGLAELCNRGQHSFSWRQGLEDCRYCGLPVDPDYEALGYPETRIFIDDPDESARWAVTLIRSVVFAAGAPELLENGEVFIINLENSG